MPKNKPITSQIGYQQALEDFAIANLLTRLKTFCDADFDAAWMNPTQSERESLAAILIRDLTANLKGNAIADYLNAIRHSNTDIPLNLVHLAFLLHPLTYLPTSPTFKPLASYLAINCAGFLMAMKQIGVSRSAGSTALLPIYVLGRGATSSSSIHSPLVLLGLLLIPLGNTTSNRWRTLYETPSSHRTRANPD